MPETTAVSMAEFRPAYLALLESGELSARAAKAREHMTSCDLCARYCRVNRLETTAGAVCRTGERAVVKEMHRQVGDLVIDASGLARRGLLVRHLVLPENLANTDKVLAFLADEVSPDTYLNVMDQYHPSYRADEHPPFDRPITAQEYRRALNAARAHGLKRLDARASLRLRVW